MEIRKAIQSDAPNISALGMCVWVDTNKFWLSAWELNHKAIGFYKKNGFKEKGEIYFDLYGDKIRNIVLEITRKTKFNP